MSLLTTIALSILALIFVLAPLIALHEWGHYIVARLCGVKVLTYSIGFGKAVWSWTSPKTGIKYQIAPIPLGGYVQMLDGREGEIPKGEEHLAFDNQHPLKKIAIVLAGPVMNFIIAFVLFWVLLVTPSEQMNTRIGAIVPDSFAEVAGLQVGDKITAIDDKLVKSWENIGYQFADHIGETTDIKVTVTPYQNDKPQATSKDYSVNVSQFMQGDDKGKDVLSAFGVSTWEPKIPPIIATISDDGVAKTAGLKIADKIIQINDRKVDNWLTVGRIISNNPNKLLKFKVLRDNKEVLINIIPQAKSENNRIVGKIGVGIDLKTVSNVKIPKSYTTTIQYDPITASFKSIEKTADLSVMTVKSIGKMLTGLIGLENLSGPITIAKVAKQSFEISWQMVVNITALISVSLAVLNLLPIPVLDGGHFMFYLIELIRGKPLAEKIQIVAFNIGAFLMGCLMLLAISLDIHRLF